MSENTRPDSLQHSLTRPRSTVDLHAEDAGYKHGLKPRQVQMIAIGGAIGTGLFLGAGGRLAQAGPSLLFIFAVCGFFAFLIIRALGELIMHRRSSGSFVSYAREFFGEKLAFAIGWIYWLNWTAVAIFDITAVALYLNFFKKYIPVMGVVPQWTYALAALVLVVVLNMASVKFFGEFEFWFSFIKVAALCIFLVIGVCFVIFGSPVPGQEVGFSLIADNGGWFPNGIFAAVVLTQGVILAYGSIELVGTAAGEAKNAEKVMPKAINSVVFRIAVFYVGSILLLALLLPYTAYQAGVSPFVTFFSSIGVTGVDAIMNFVVLTAALSSLNAGMYSTGRILRSLSVAGSAPMALQKMNRSGVPYVGILLTAVVALIGVGVNAIVPEQAFEIALNVSALLLMCSWATIVACQLRLWQWSKKGIMTRPNFRMPWAPYSGIAVLVFLMTCAILTALDWPVGTYTVASTPIVAVLLILGWFLVRNRVREVAHQREGYTDSVPVVDGRSLGAPLVKD